MGHLVSCRIGLVAALLLICGGALCGEDWTQFKYDARNSGDAADRDVSLPLKLLATAPLTDAIFTAPVVGQGRVFVMDGSGVVGCFDSASLSPLWKFETPGGTRNCNNVSSPALAGPYLHVGTMAGNYYVLEAATGKLVREISCGEPIFSAPVVGARRVYFATLGARVYALEPDGQVAWTWDYVAEMLGFQGDRWSGTDWQRTLQRRVTNRELFMCSQDIALDGDTLVIPAGGTLVWLEDAGAAAKPRRRYAPHNATLSLALGADGTAYRQSHWLDNGGQLEILPPAASRDDSALEEVTLGTRASIREGVQYVTGTRTSTRGGLISFASPSIRGADVYRCRPEEGFAFCHHATGRQPRSYAGCYPSNASPILLRDKALFGGLDGLLYAVSLESGAVWSFPTFWRKPISAPVAVSDGRVYFGCEDGYLYALGTEGKERPAPQPLDLWKIRSPRSGPSSDSKYDRFTSFADWGNSNANDLQPTPPFRLHWIRRYEGTTKHHSSFGGGRVYTHTAEGQIFAVEQETGRLLWRRYFPGVHICYTTPLYYQERLLVPQAGLQDCRLRCLDAATGELLWEAPFSGSPSWNRQLPPVICRDLAIYAFSTGRYGPEVPAAERLEWLFEHQNVTGFPQSHRPLVRAYDLKTGREVWTADFSQYGAGGDEAGICLLDGRIFYSCYFGRRVREPGPKGLTAELDPATGKTVWLTTDYSIHGGCTISGQDGRLYLGGYNPLAGTEGRHVWCLDARDGSLIWQSEPLREAIHVATIGPEFIFVHAQYRNGYLLDKATGKILATLADGYKCSRFTLSGSTLLGPAIDLLDLSNSGEIKLLSSGPRMDPSECIGACVSNGRIFYTGHGAGLQASLLYGAEAAAKGP